MKNIINKRVLFWMSTVVGLFIFFLFFLKSLFFFDFYRQNLEPYLPYQVFQRFIHQIDLVKAVIPKGFNKEDKSINLDLSIDDMLAFQEVYHNSIINQNYLDDKDKRWRKSKITFTKSEEKKVKVKIHGTSYGPIINSLSPIDALTYFHTGKIDKNSIDVARGGYAFKIKIKSDDSYFNNMKRINLLSPFDDWSIASNAINKYISSWGLVTSYGDIVKLHINGNIVGPYLAVEQIGKELLERNYKITNYAILKSNDDWNKGFGAAHISSTDYTSNDKEGSGEFKAISIANNQLDKLFNAIELKDIDTIYSLVDIEDMAKISAMVRLTGSVSPLHGDNVRYIYDMSTGRFTIVYRLEHSPMRLSELSPGYFDLEDFKDLQIHKIFPLLNKDRKFINLRNEFLQKIINSEKEIFSLIEDNYKKNVQTLSEVNFPTNYHIFGYRSDIKNLKNNLNIIKKYLSYVKIYATIKKNANEGVNLEVLLDSYSPVIMLGVYSCNDNKYYKFDQPIRLINSNYSTKDGYIKANSITKVDLPFECINDIKAIKEQTGENVDSSNIYINHSTNVDMVYKSGLEQFGSGLIIKSSISDNTKKYIVLEGSYHLEKDVIFPKNSNIVFRPGVDISLNPNISILAQGGVSAIGTKERPIKITKKRDKPFGSFAILGSKNNKNTVNLKNFHINGGSEKIINGVYFSSQISIHMADVNIESSSFKNSYSDDGLNIKFSKLKIINSIFENNKADQIDLDYSDGEVINNKFTASQEALETDGLDVSGSTIYVASNDFFNMTDKGISIGEKSKVLITNNMIKDNNTGIAVKDGSSVCLNGNNFIENKMDILSYVKKKMYSTPSVQIKNQIFDNVSIISHLGLLTDLNSLPECNPSKFL